MVSTLIDAKAANMTASTAELPQLTILLAHNRYAYRGGEDTVFDQERELLRSHGHKVVEFTKDNAGIGDVGKLGLAISTVWAKNSYQELARLIASAKPDIIHVHNTFPLISPAIYYAAARHAVPVVQTLHNYRLVCPNGMLQRQGAVCELCVNKTVAWPAVRYACYRGDHAASAALTAALALHRAAGTWRTKVARYIALSHFSRKKLLAAGMPGDTVVVKPNFAVDRHGSAATRGDRSGALFVGRLSSEKGLQILMHAWRDLDVDLKVPGQGPMVEILRRATSERVKPLGYISDSDLAQCMRQAAFLVMPTLVYEGFPMVVAEAFAAGLPIIASRLGALAELVEDGVTGLHFEAGNPKSLAEKVRWAAANPDAVRQMGRNARTVYEGNYTPEHNHASLMRIYREAREAIRARMSSTSLQGRSN
jgi:glycosyltransferase involved in cell wall biosynthesis